MKIVVTGGSGQLGTLVVERLVAARAIKRVVSIDLHPPRACGHKLEHHTLDITSDDLRTVMEGADAVIHLAFVVVSGARSEVMHRVNVEGSRRVFEAAAAAGVRAVVYASSVAAYGAVQGHPEPIVESTPRQRSPHLTYADNKFEVEAYLDDFEAHRPELRVVRLRPGILFGARMEHPGMELMRHRIALQLADVPMPIVWDEDVADAAIAALERDVRGAFNLVADTSLSPRELADASSFRFVRAPPGTARAYEVLFPALRRFTTRLPEPGWLTSQDVRLIVSSDRARAELGWRPTCPTAADVVRRFDACAPQRLDRRVALLVQAIDRAARQVPDSFITPEQRRVHGLVHLELTGRRGGDVTIRIDAGRARLRIGAPRSPSSRAIVDVRTFMCLMSGREELSTAVFTGRVRFRGDPTARMMIGALVVLFRRAVQHRGPRGWAARKLSDWVGSGVGEEPVSA